MSYGVGTAWGWVINDLIFIFGWTNPLRSTLLLFPRCRNQANINVRQYNCWLHVNIHGSLDLQWVVRNYIESNILFQLLKLFVLVTFPQFPLLNPVTQQIFATQSGRGGLFRRESHVNAFPYCSKKLYIVSFLGRTFFFVVVFVL